MGGRLYCLFDVHNYVRQYVYMAGYKIMHVLQQSAL